LVVIWIFGGALHPVEDRCKQREKYRYILFTQGSAIHREENKRVVVFYCFVVSRKLYSCLGLFSNPELK
jgi:hypothetical protein